MVKNDKAKQSECPYCDNFKGMYTRKERCDHAKKFHLPEIMDWLENGPVGIPRLNPESEQRLSEQRVDPICWAAGMIMCTQ